MVSALGVVSGTVRAYWKIIAQARSTVMPLSPASRSMEAQDALSVPVDVERPVGFSTRAGAW